MTVEWRTGLVAAMMVPALAGAQEPRVERTLSLHAADRPLELDVADVYRLGSPGAAEWQQFGHVRAVDFGPDGRLYILDQQAAQVHAVDPSGERIGAVGGNGEGPGEYQLPTGLVVGPDGTILVRDTRSGSYVLFDPSGEYVENVRPDATEGQVSGFDLGPDGWLYGVPSLLLGAEAGSSLLTASYLVGGGQTVENARHLPLVRVHLRDGDPRVLDRLWIAPRNADGGRAAQVAFLPQMHWAVLPDGAVAVADSTLWSVRIRASHVGRPDMRLTRPIDPRPVTDRMREAELERRAREGPSGGGGSVVFGGTADERNEALARERQRRMEATLGFYPEIQVIQGIRADPAGRLWIARAAEDPHGDGPIDVIDSEGAYLGTIEGMALPDAFGPDGLAAWVEIGEMDVPIVVVRRITLG